MHKILLPLMAVLCASTAANSAVVVDQEVLATELEGYALIGSGLHYSPPEHFVHRVGQIQSVTANRTGLLTQIDLQLYGYSNSLEFNVGLVRGEPGVSGEIVPHASLKFDMNQLPAFSEARTGKLFSVDVASLGFEITRGEKYSIYLYLGPLDPEAILPLAGPYWVYGVEPLPRTGEFYPQGYLDYQGGFNTLLNGDGTRALSAADRGFRTWVDVGGVPEPASWALMIGGFGMVGSVLRRRRLLTV